MNSRYHDQKGRKCTNIPHNFHGIRDSKVLNLVPNELALLSPQNNYPY